MDRTDRSDGTLQADYKNPSTALEHEIAALGPWFHNLHLPGGLQTAPDHPLGDFPAFKWRQVAPHVPEDLTGWTVLDIGCNAGYYAFELARRGARVTAIDLDPRYLRQAQWAARLMDLHDRIEFRQLSVYDLAGVEESYDLVWFMGVLYHLRYPLLGLDLVCRKTRRLLMLQTLMMPGEAVAEGTETLKLEDIERMREPGWPRMAFIEHRLEGDPTNWWAPNHAGIEAMLRSCGMRVLTRPAREIYLCAPAPDAAAQWRALQDELDAATGRARP